MLIKSVINYGVGGAVADQYIPDITIPEAVPNKTATYNNAVEAGEEVATVLEQTISETNTKNPSFMEKVKAFFVTKPLQAAAITIAVGALLGWFLGKKLFTGKGKW